MTSLRIDDTATVTTVISTFDAEPEDQAQLVDRLTPTPRHSRTSRTASCPAASTSATTEPTS